MWIASIFASDTNDELFYIHNFLANKWKKTTDKVIGEA